MEGGEEFFERRGREGFAEIAEKKFKIWFSFLRPLRRFRALCVQKCIRNAFKAQAELSHECEKSFAFARWHQP
jgi:hypothetical protein